MNKYLSTEDKKEIKKAIDKIESKSSAEIVVAVTDFISSSKSILFLYSLSFTAIITVVLLGTLFENNYKLVAEFSVVISLFTFFSLLYNPYAYKIIPKSIKKTRCDDFALYQFKKLGVDKTSNHKAVLIFICQRERFIRVVADKQINDIVPDETWQKIVSRFTSQAKDGQIAKGLLHAVENCGKILTEKFPKEGQNRDELSNNVIEI